MVGRMFRARPVPRGVIFSAASVAAKSFLMDAFYASAARSSAKVRACASRLCAACHAELRGLETHGGDPLVVVAEHPG